LSAASPIRVGFVGLGAAGRAFLPAIKKHSGFELVCIAEPVQETRDSVAAAMNVAAYEDMSAMLRGTDIDAVYIATPTDLHSAHVKIAFAARKHVLSEKPMALDLPSAQVMVADADRAGVVFLVGHAHGFDLPIQRMREIIASGRLGRVRMIHTWNYTDWMYRPRRPEELEVAKGGGVTFRQGSHQFDIIRLLGGGLVRSVRAVTFDWDPGRHSIGAHTIFMHFGDGTTATAIYNGYGYFSTMELCSDVTEWGSIEPIERRPAVVRSSAGRSAAEEAQAKRQRAKGAIPTDVPFQPTFGLTVVSCERGDIRQSPRGLFIYSADGREEIVLPTDSSPRDLVLDEFHDAITGRRTPIHDGRWGLANLEVCVAAIESSQTGREIELKHQIPVPR
jgi:phthalate 4,5-cis-dihydrodiol dehydrogenase